MSETARKLVCIAVWLAGILLAVGTFISLFKINDVISLLPNYITNVINFALTYLVKARQICNIFIYPPVLTICLNCWLASLIAFPIMKVTYAVTKKLSSF